MALCRSLVRVPCLLRPSRCCWVSGHNRKMSDTSGELVLSHLDSTGVATVQLNRPPVNGLSLELLTALGITLDKLDAEKECRGIILTSASNGVFCAGLDIKEMHRPNEARLREFWRSFQDVWMKLYTARHATVAAINGHAPAGGCMLALSCDYRIMSSGKFSIGLNETKLGIVAPFWLMDTLINTVGQRQAELGLQLGLMYTADEAKRIQMVDEVVPMDQVLSAAKQQMQQWLQIPDVARLLSKLALRQHLVEKLRRKQQEDIDNFVNFVTKEAVQKSIDIYLKSLKKK